MEMMQRHLARKFVINLCAAAAAAAARRLTPFYQPQQQPHG